MLSGRVDRTFFPLPRAAAAAGAACGAPSGAASAPTLGGCVRASVGRRAEGRPWEGGWVAERQKGDGWAKGVGRQERVTTRSRYVFLRAC